MFFFGNGEMAADEVLNHMEYPGEDYEPYSGGREFNRYDPTGLATCKYCGRSSLTWGRASGGSRLFEPDDSLHICKAYKKKMRKKQLLQGR